MAQSTHPGCPSCFPVLMMVGRQCTVYCLYDISDSALHVCRRSALDRLRFPPPGSGELLPKKVRPSFTYKHASQPAAFSVLLVYSLVWILQLSRLCLYLPLFCLYPCLCIYNAIVCLFYLASTYDSLKTLEHTFNNHQQLGRYQNIKSPITPQSILDPTHLANITYRPSTISSNV